MNPADLAAWHRRYLQQARWTAEIRRHTYRQVDLARAGHVLEIGCGTGAILSELPGYTQGEVFGIDLLHPAVRFARDQQPAARLAAADTHRLPFPDGAFDAVLCHFLLLWVTSIPDVLAEARRVTRSGGVVLALAEPDYAARIDYPEPLEILGRLQREALKGQGADTRAGRRLREAFHRAGLVDVQAGLVGGYWSSPPAREDFELEWEVLRRDVGSALPVDRLAALQEADWQAWQTGSRVLFVPTFYAWGTVP